MSKPLSYLPPVPVDTGPQDDVDDLVAALHESGLLRVMAGGARAYPQLLGTLLRSIDAAAIRSAIELAGSLRDLDPGESAQVAAGVRRARAEAVAAADGPAEGPIALFRRLRDPNTRRGLSAALAALAAVGGSLPRS